MPSAISQHSRSTHSVGSAPEAAAVKGEGALFEEFSNLLDKISLQLENTHELQPIAPATAAPVNKVATTEEKATTEKDTKPTEDSVQAESVEKVEHCEEGAESCDAVSEEGESSEVAEEIEEEVEEHEEGNCQSCDDEGEAPQMATECEVVVSEDEETPQPDTPVIVAQVPAEQVVDQLLKETSEPEGSTIEEKVEVAADGVASVTPETVEATPGIQVVSEQKPTVVETVIEEKKVDPEKPVVAQPQGIVEEQSKKPEQAAQAPAQAQFQPEQKQETQVVKEFVEAVQRIQSVPKEQAGPKESEELVKAFQALLQDRTAQTPAAPAAGEARFATGRTEFFASLLQGSSAKAISEIAFGKHGESISSVSSANQAQGGQHENHSSSAFANKAREIQRNVEKDDAQELSKGQELRTMKKVEEALKEVAKSRDGKTISLRLDPPSLGSVRVDVSLRDGVLHARLAADNANVNNLLREKSQELQQMLRALGLEVDSVSVSVRQDGGSGEGHDSSAQDEQEFQQYMSGDSGATSSTPSGSLSSGAIENSTTMDHWVA